VLVIFHCHHDCSKYDNMIFLLRLCACLFVAFLQRTLQQKEEERNEKDRKKEMDRERLHTDITAMAER
jgi:hypothetical protein